MIVDALLSMAMALFFPCSVLSGIILAAALCTSFAITYKALLSNAAAGAEPQLSLSSEASPVLPTDVSFDDGRQQNGDAIHSTAVCFLSPSPSSTMRNVLTRRDANTSGVLSMLLGDSGCWHTDGRRPSFSCTAADGRFLLRLSTATSLEPITRDVNTFDICRGLPFCHHIRGLLRLTSLASVGDAWSPDPG